MKSVFIIGPTSSGKTTLSLTLAEKFRGRIISVDSRQIYKHLDIGTGKMPGLGLTSEKLKNCWLINGIKVFGYDLVTPDQFFSAHDFKLYAQSLPSSEEISIFAGGTGFYFDVLLGNVKLANVPPNPELRAKLDKLKTSELVEKLTSLNPKRAYAIDTNNRVRLIRAIEIESEESPTQVKDPETFLENPLIVGLISSRENLYRRADAWFDSALNMGLVSEVQKLLELGYSDTKPMNGLIYKTVQSYIKGEISIDRMSELCKFELHAYIRRQETYFGRFKDVFWFDVEKEAFDTDIVRLVESKLDE